MKILVTGAKGFIGKNLVSALKNRDYAEVMEYDKDMEPFWLEDYCRKTEFVFHLAGVNRPKEESEFMAGNFRFTSVLLDTLKRYNNNCPIVLSSSIHAEKNSHYGESKKAGEDLLFKYGRETGAKVLVYRFPNVFGKWSKPNYNSAVATFCYNIARGLPITVNDPYARLTLVYIDDVVDELIRAIEGKENRAGKFCEVPVVHTATLGEIVDLLNVFQDNRSKCFIPDMSDPFTKKLYSTYLSYLPEERFSYELKMNIDYRGSFTEFLRTVDRGQVAINISKPGIVKGNHWHHTKNEKFLVVSGRGVIRLRRIDSDKILEYFVSDKKMEVVDIPPGYAHNIENLGDTDMVTVMWANEPFDPEKPDTYPLEV